VCEQWDCNFAESYVLTTIGNFTYLAVSDDVQSPGEDIVGFVLFRFLESCIRQAHDDDERLS